MANLAINQLPSARVPLISADIAVFSQSGTPNKAVQTPLSSVATYISTNLTTLNLGSSGVAGTLTVFPATASKGTLVLQATNNTGNTATTITNAAMAGVRTITIPDPNVTSTNFLLADAQTNQTINTGSLTLAVGSVTCSQGSFQAGSSGHAGSFSSFPATANSGQLVLSASNQAGNFLSILTNAALGQATTFTLPDPGASAANLLISTQASAQSITRSAGTGNTLAFIGDASNTGAAMDQLVIKTRTNNNIQLIFGVSQATGAGGIQAVTQGVGGNTLYLNPATGNVQVGSNNSGLNSTFSVFPGANNVGSIVIAPISASGNFTTTISNAAIGQSTTYTLPDSGTANTKIITDTLAGGATIGFNNPISAPSGNVGAGWMCGSLGVNLPGPATGSVNITSNYQINGSVKLTATTLTLTNLSFSETGLTTLGSNDFALSVPTNNNISLTAPGTGNITLNGSKTIIGSTNAIEFTTTASYGRIISKPGGTAGSTFITGLASNGNVNGCYIGGGGAAGGLTWMAFTTYTANVTNSSRVVMGNSADFSVGAGFATIGAHVSDLTDWDVLAINPTGVANSFGVSIGFNAAPPAGNILYINGAGFSSQALWNIASDNRMKKNIKELKESIVDKFSKLKVYTYESGKNWIDYCDHAKGSIGIMAQELEAVFPRLVQISKDVKGRDGTKLDMKMMSQGALIPLCIGAINELTERIQTLESKTIH